MIFLAIMETEHYSWYGVGKTEKRAVIGVQKTWNMARKEDGQMVSWDYARKNYGVNVVKMPLGEGVQI